MTAVGQIIYICGEGGGAWRWRWWRWPSAVAPLTVAAAGPGSRVAQNMGIRIEMDRGTRHVVRPAWNDRGLDADILEYNIYLDATHQTVWGNGVGGTEVYIDLNPPLETPVIVPVFGRIFGRQDVAAG